MSFARIAGAVLMLSLVAVSGDRVHTQQPAVAAVPVSSSRGHDCRRAPRYSGGPADVPGLVQAYVNRARAYNGTCNQLVTEDMAPKFLPNYAEYAAAVAATACCPPATRARHRPSNSGGWKPTASDPGVQQQFGMTVGIPDAGQVRAIGMINMRGERSRHARATSIGIRPPGRCRRERPRSARNSAVSPTPSSAPQNWTRSTAAIPICSAFRCTAFRSRSRTRMK